MLYGGSEYTFLSRGIQNVFFVLLFHRSASEQSRTHCFPIAMRPTIAITLLAIVGRGAGLQDYDRTAN